MSAVETNRNSVELPVDVSQEILQKTQESSAVMQLARQITVPGRGVAVNVITGDPQASWVAETAAKPVSNPSLTTKVLRPYKLAVIVPFSQEFRRDVSSLYTALIQRLPNALGQKFDNTVFGGTAVPGSDFDSLAAVTTQVLDYDGLVKADTDIATNGGILNGFALSPQAKGVLLRTVDKNGRPLFINNVSEGAVPVILGANTLVTKGAYVSGDTTVVGFAGDWTQAVYGTVEGVKVDISEEATLDLGDGNLINLFQQNMFAVRAEIEVGFRADTSVFNAFTAPAEG